MSEDKKRNTFASTEEWQARTVSKPPMERRNRVGPLMDQTPEDEESGWGEGRSHPAPRRWWYWGAVLLAPVAAGALWLAMSRGSPPDQGMDDARRDSALAGLRKKLEEEERDPLGEAALSAEQVARRFLAERDPEKRLAWVRTPELAAEHLPRYSEEARTAGPTGLRLMGVSEVDGRTSTGFVVEFAGGSLRLLNLVETPAGPKVDWDSYARYCSKDWPKLLEGASESAEVRVFVSPGHHPEAPFDDVGAWTCFRFSSPDLPHDVHGYARVGTVREVRLKALVLGSRQHRQHMTLQVLPQREGAGEVLFEIERVLAVGWTRAEGDAEDSWEKGGQILSD